MQKMYRLLSVLELALRATIRARNFVTSYEWADATHARFAAAELRCKPPYGNATMTRTPRCECGHISVQPLSSEFKSEAPFRRPSTLNDP